MGQLQLRRHYPSEIQYILSDDIPSGELKIECGITLNAGHNTDNPLDWRVTTQTTFRVWKENKDIIKGHITFVGFFGVPIDIDATERAGYVSKFATPILYSAAREVIANLTGRAPMTPIALPHMSFEKFGSRDAPTDVVEGD